MTQYRLPAHSHDERAGSRVVAGVLSVGAWLPACAGQALGVLRSYLWFRRSSWRQGTLARRPLLQLLLPVCKQRSTTTSACDEHRPLEDAGDFVRDPKSISILRLRILARHAPTFAPHGGRWRWRRLEKLPRSPRKASGSSGLGGSESSEHSKVGHGLVGIGGPRRC